MQIRYATFSFVNSMILLIINCIGAIRILEMMISDGEYSPRKIFLFQIGIFFCITGLVFTGMSHFKKEKAGLLKSIGAILNIFFSLVAVGLILFQLRINMIK